MAADPRRPAGGDLEGPASHLRYIISFSIISFSIISFSIISFSIISFSLHYSLSLISGVKPIYI